MTRLCFGGSFNPIHHGHLACSRAVARVCSFDRVVLIPSASPPHKLPNRQGGASDLAPADDRIEMCRLAVAGDALYEVDDLEAHRSGPSYTLDTVRELRRRGGDWADQPVHWLIGADSLLQLPTWHQPLALLEEVHFVVMARPGWAFDWERLPPPFRKLRENVVEAPLIDISATDIRRRVRAGEPIDDLTPKPVADYIRERGLYR